MGTYYLKPNSLALVAHVANAGYVVAQHSLNEARRLGFRSMQFNLVVGILPGAFRHKQLGYVDALVMVQVLVEGPTP